MLLVTALVLIIGGGVAAGAWWVQRGDAESSVSPGTYVPPSEISSTSPSSTSTTKQRKSDKHTKDTQGTKGAKETTSSSSSSSSSSSTTSSSSSSSTSESSTSDSGGSTLAPDGSPSRVLVDSGGEELVDASLQATQLDSDNVLAPPFGTAGWYAEPGWPKPGFNGASILVGHINHGGNPDVFWNLPKASAGDVVTVKYTSGEQVKFRITRSEAASKSGVPDDASIWDYDNPDPVLRMITCDPQTTFEDGHYEGNWVVWAEPL